MEERSDCDSSEIDDLRYRISQLEHLVTNTLNTSPGLNVNSSSIQQSCCCNASVPQGLINRANQLESLLAASELECRKLQEEIVLLNTDRNRNHVVYLENLKIRDKEIEDLNYNMKLLQGKGEKYKQRFENVKNYINTLPSEDELSDAKHAIDKLETDNHFLKDKVYRLETKLTSMQQEIFKKESEYQDALVRLDELKPLEKAQEDFLSGGDRRLQQLNFSNKQDVIEFITIQKAQLNRSKDIVTSFKEKIAKLTEDKSQCMAKLLSQSMILQESQERLVGFQMEIDKLAERLQVLQQEKGKLTSQCENFQSLVSANDNFRKIREEQLGSIVKLVMEIDLCVFEMQKSIELTQKICSGEEPAVDTFIGLSDFDFHVDILCEPVGNEGNQESTQEEDGQKQDSESSSRLDPSVSRTIGDSKSDADVDTEWVLERWEKVRDLRKTLATVRSQLNDFYADKLSGTIDGCTVQ